MKISVALVSYNGEKYIVEQLESIFICSVLRSRYFSENY
jgi:glycosyltransferase involved in cell wall biosynthesis